MWTLQQKLWIFAPRKAPGFGKFLFLFLITKIAQEYIKIVYSNFRIHKAANILKPHMSIKIAQQAQSFPGLFVLGSKGATSLAILDRAALSLLDLVRDHRRQSIQRACPGSSHFGLPSGMRKLGGVQSWRLHQGRMSGLGLREKAHCGWRWSHDQPIRKTKQSQPQSRLP